MNFRGVSRRTWLQRALSIALAMAVVVALAHVGERLTTPPRTQTEAEAHLERSIIAYALWDDVPYIVFEYGGTVHFDRLVLDLVSIDWPPTPRWQWTGMWATIDTTGDPASVGTGRTRPPRAANPAGPRRADGDVSYEPVIYGQVNSREIAWLDVLADGGWERYPVAYPGFLIRLAEGQSIPNQYRWLDTDGQVIWSVDRDAG